MKTFTPQQYGAKADGIADDTSALETAIREACKVNGCVRLAAGHYKFTRALVFPTGFGLSIIGDGEGVTKLVASSCSGLHFQLMQSIYNQQPYGITMEGFTFMAQNNCGLALGIDYREPVITNDHNRQSIRLTNIVVESSFSGKWSNGIDIADAWNVTLDNVYVSGDSAGGVWNNMSGTGINLRRMTVNSHFSNVRTNFWSTGIKAHASSLLNTEGLFFSNCSMVGVKRGLWVKGNPAVGAGRISTVNWTGGMIEARVGGVVGGSAAIHLENVWTSLIHGCQFITETITENVENTYGVVLQDCHGVVVSGNDINAWIYGVFTTGDCRAINVIGNTYTNTATQVVFNPGTTNSRSFGAVLVNVDRNEQDHGVNNVVL